MTWSSLPLLHTLMTFKSSKIFLWSALEPCSPVGKWLDGAPPKRYPDTTHTTQHCWRSPKPLVHNYSWIKSLDWSSLWGEPIWLPQVWDIWLEWSECWKIHHLQPLLHLPIHQLFTYLSASIITSSTTPYITTSTTINTTIFIWRTIFIISEMYLCSPLSHHQ